MAAFHAGGPQLVATAFSHRRPSRRGKARCFAIGLSLPFRHRAVFASRLTDCKALLCLGCAHRARTAKLLRTGQRRSQWGTFLAGAAAPRLLRKWQSNRSLAGRAPCAPQRKGIGLANGRALRTNRALPQWLVKGLLFDHPFHIPWLAKGKPFGQSFLIHCPVKDLEKGNPARLRLFSTFFHVPLARSSRFCYTCNRQRWAGPSKGARVTPIPLWIERKNE